MRRVIIPERWEKIIDLVEEQDGASVEEIGRALDISAPTVRRDLARIQQRGLIDRTRGGAAPSSGSRLGLTLAESRRVNPAEKELIGRVAADNESSHAGFQLALVVRQILDSSESKG